VGIPFFCFVPPFWRIMHVLIDVLVFFENLSIEFGVRFLRVCMGV